MADAQKLAETFLTNARGRFAPPADAAGLGRMLDRAWEAARAQWPTVALPAELFVQHVAERLPQADPGSPIESLLERLSLVELYLACACAHGIPGALAAFERQYLAKLPALLGYLKRPALIDDICQLTRVKLLVRTPEDRPRITDYTGRGALLSWVRVIASRIAIKQNSADKPAPDESVTDVLEAVPAPGGDAEMDIIKQRHHAEFRAAIHEAFAALSPDERHLLRLYFVDRLSTYELGTLFGMSQPTISRWLKSVRKTIHDETWRLLQTRLRLAGRDIESFLAVLDSQLDISISQLFKEEDALPQPRP